MAKRKAKRIAKPRARKPVVVSPVMPVVPLHDAVLVAIPIEKTKHTMWQQFVDWLKQ